MVKNTFEKHSVRTLALRFKGLASRNTIVRWIKEGKLRPELTDKTPAPYLFVRSVLDNAETLLDTIHTQRVERLIKNKAEAQRVRLQVRANCVQTLMFNDSAEFSGKPHLCKKETDPTLNDQDAIGATTTFDANEMPKFRISSGLGIGKEKESK